MAASSQAPQSLLMTETRLSNTGQRGQKKLWVNVMICTEDVANVCRHAIPRQESGISLLNVLDRFRFHSFKEFETNCGLRGELNFEFHSEDEEITMDVSQNELEKSNATGLNDQKPNLEAGESELDYEDKSDS